MIKLTAPIKNDQYTRFVYDSLDIQNRDQTETNIQEIDKGILGGKWGVGLIVGGSGTGKTTLLRETFGFVGRPETLDSTKSLISCFDHLSPQEAVGALTGVGLSSVPSWLRQYCLLSTGEQARASMAYWLSKEKGTVVFDEFSSTVDRDVAKAICVAVRKYVDKANKQIVLSSCHHDIVEWLRPDWIHSTFSGATERGDCLRRPEISLNVCRTESGSWNLFKTHHYLTAAVNRSCKFFVFEWNTKPIGIIAILNTPRNNMPEGVSISRVVVLPDYQGMGFGKHICKWAGGVFKNEGNRLFIKTVNPALGIYFEKTPTIWRPTSKNGKVRKDINDQDGKYKNNLARSSYCYEYCGEPLKGYESLLKPINEMRNDQKDL